MWGVETNPVNHDSRNCLGKILKAIQKGWNVMQQEIKAHASNREDLDFSGLPTFMEVTNDGNDLRP